MDTDTKTYVSTDPIPRAQALEEAARKHLKWFERFICDQDELNSSTPRKVAQNAQNAAEELRAAIRALSSQDHADAGNVERDGWLPIETAPKDGTEFIGWDGKWPFRCSAGKNMSYTLTWTAGQHIATFGMVITTTASL